MTQEEKARAYDSIIEKANKMHSENCDACKACIEELIPELAESEDEKIRKDILDCIQYMKANYCIPSRYTSKQYDTWIAWLEKQGEQKSADKEYTFKSIPRLLEMIEPTDRAKSYCKKLIDSLQTEGYSIDAKIVGECLRQMNGKNVPMAVMDIEKQGEQKPILEFKAKDWYVSKVDGKIRNIYHSVDKVEPKFHEGNLVVDNCGYVWKIEGILNQFYILEGIEGGKSHPTIEWVNKTYHLWTIQDAKDGDVLATDKSVFIYAKVLYSKPYAYCGVDKFGVFKDNSLKHDWANSVDNIHPATKEQRDLLFQKMNEAGYEWDAENKQLNKIHIVHDTYCQENCKGFQETGKCFADGECKAKREAEQKKEENKGNIGGIFPNWSEEDEKFVHGLIRGLAAKRDIHGHTTFSSDCIDITETINWLQSIKGRVQPKQEWSEEDESILQGIWDEILANKHDAEECEWKTYDKFLNWLKSLKPQNRWKPSSKQISQLQTVIDTYGKKGIYDPILTELLFQLKELYFS